MSKPHTSDLHEWQRYIYVYVYISYVVHHRSSRVHGWARLGGCPMLLVHSYAGVEIGQVPDAKALASLEECNESLDVGHQPTNSANSIPGKISVTCPALFRLLSPEINQQCISGPSIHTNSAKASYNRIVEWEFVDLAELHPPRHLKLSSMSYGAAEVAGCASLWFSNDQKQLTHVLNTRSDHSCGNGKGL